MFSPSEKHHPNRHRILLTGGSGALGRNFLDLSGSDPAVETLVLLREGSRAPPAAGNRRIVRSDLENFAAIKDIVETFAPTCVIHSAATGMKAPKPTFAELIRFNVGWTVDFYETVSTASGCPFIFISSGLAYKDQAAPIDERATLETLHPYGASKAAADNLIRSAAQISGSPLTILRPFSFTGPWDDGSRLFPYLLRSAVAGEPADLSPGAQRRDHLSVRDIAAAIQAAVLHPPAPGENPRIFNLGSGSNATLRELLEDIKDQLGLNLTFRFGARDYAPFEPMSLIADTTEAKGALGWRPRHNLAHAVWQLAQQAFPSLTLKEPEEAYRV